MIDEGIDVRIFPDTVGSLDNVHDDVAEYDLQQDIVHKRLPAGRLSRTVDAVGGLLQNGLRHPSLYGEVIVGDTKQKRWRGLKFWHDAAWRGPAYAACDIFCCHHGPQGLRAVSLKKAGLTMAPIVTFIHGYDITQYVAQRGDGCYDELFEHADLLLPISERWKEKLVALGCSPDKVRVHRMGVDLGKFTYRERSREPGRHPVRLVSVARLTEKKGIRYAVEAVGMLRDRGVDVIYEIVGDGRERAHLEKRINDLGLRDRVRLVGKKYDRELLRVLDETDIFVLPSVTTNDGDQEGLPVVLMEAMALGVPVVSTWHSGIPELVRDRQNGLLVQERDVAGLADALERLVRHPDEATEMAYRGRESVESQHDVAQLNTELARIFSELAVTA